MKKYVWIVLVISALGFALWEDIVGTWITPENYLEPWKTKIINQDISPGAANNIQDITLRFCNEMEEQKFTVDLSLNMRPWQRKEICIALSNDWDAPSNVMLGFADGKIKNGNVTCENDITYENDFSKFILQGPTTWIIVPAHGNIIQRVKYRASNHASGDIVGCAVYKINQEEKVDPGKMFVVVVRKIAPIKISVAWPVYTLWRWDDIKDVYTINKQILLKIVIALLSIRILVTIFQSSKGKEKNHSKK